MKVLIIGGDGFCGWPASLYLSSKGHQIMIVDNLVRRQISKNLKMDSLTKLASIDHRIEAWQKLTGETILFRNIDVSFDFDELLKTLVSFTPDTIIHFAEQRSAPYSMLNVDSRLYTVRNNLTATHNVLTALTESKIDAHLIHLGSVGVYGYSTLGFKIPEGYLNVVVKNDSKLIEKKILFPSNPESIYHMTKAQDQLFFQYYCKNFACRITDLHQGIVWGSQTDETLLHPDLVNRFDYDGIYGTVLNRFIIQAANRISLTVYGNGGQTRAFIHLKDTIRCIEIATANPNTSDEVRILNQITETSSVLNLAKIVNEIEPVGIEFHQNLRKEPESNEFEVSNNCFISMGLDNVIRFDSGYLNKEIELAKEYSEYIQKV